VFKKREKGGVSDTKGGRDETRGDTNEQSGKKTGKERSSVLKTKYRKERRSLKGIIECWQRGNGKLRC